MIHLQREYRFLDCTDEYVFLKDEDLKVISFDRKDLLFIFNFHPSNSLVDFPVPTRLAGILRVVFDSDERRFGGIGGRISHECDMHALDGRVKVYMPPRTCAVLSAKDGTHSIGI
jgi:1,4-alpha-glucan branching enzyme